MSKKMSKEEEEIRRRFRKEFIDYDIWIQEFSREAERKEQLLFNINNNLKRIADSLDAIFLKLQKRKTAIRAYRLKATRFSFQITRVAPCSPG